MNTAIQPQRIVQSKRAILTLRAAGWSSDEICQALRVSLRTLRYREQEIRAQAQERQCRRDLERYLP